MDASSRSFPDLPLMPEMYAFIAIAVAVLVVAASAIYFLLTSSSTDKKKSQTEDLFKESGNGTKTASEDSQAESIRRIIEEQKRAEQAAAAPRSMPPIPTPNDDVPVGGSTDKYSWQQTETEVEVRVPVAPSLGKNGVSVGFKPRTLSVTIAGEQIISGDLYREVVSWHLMQYI